MSRSIRALSLTLLAAAYSYGQVTGRITGSVVDPAGASVPRAKVSVSLAGGASALVETQTSARGLFTVETVRPELYDLVIEAPGFQPQKIRNVKVDPARTTDLPVTKLEIAAAAASVEVTAQVETVQVTSTDVSTTLTSEQIQRLPVSDRYAMNFVGTQAGVAYSASIGVSTINGQLPSFTGMTLDGISIQDNYLRTNAVDFTPNLLTLGQVREFTVTSSNSGGSAVGASQINAVTPSGGNQLHGEALWQNRVNRFAANDWFNNTDGIPLQRYARNQGSGSLSGPIKRDKLFYFGNYELQRFRSDTSQDQIIPTADARQGIFTYRTAQGQIVKNNILNTVGLKIDPEMAKNLALVPGPEKINNFRVGDSQPGQLLNTAGYSFLVRDNRDQDNVTGKLDYYLSTRHSFAGSFLWNRDLVDRPDSGVGYSSIPPVKNDDTTKFLSVAWRWNPTPAFTNEVRGGFNLSTAYFINSEQLPAYLIGGRQSTSDVTTGTIWDSPVATAGESGTMSQGRDTHTYGLQDNAHWLRGRHDVQFGYQIQGVRVRPYDYVYTVPTYYVGTTSQSQQDFLLFSGDLRGVSTADLGRANLLLASLAGLLDYDYQYFNVTSRTSGFVAGAPNLRHYILDNHAFYVEDHWKALKRLTLTGGMRWDYYAPVNERDSLQLQPLMRGDARATLLSNATLYFSGNEVQRPFYGRDLNNFGPSVGLAWDVLGNGKTSFRAGYGINFVNDEGIAVTQGFATYNSGLQGARVDFDLPGTMATRQTIKAPAYKVPRTFADNYADDPTTYHDLIDPNLRTPYVQQFSASIQHEFKSTIFEARYVGNHATKLLRRFDYNQEDVRAGGFLDDFLRAKSNGDLARAATGVFNPAYNAQIRGSQVLTVLPTLLNRGFLTDPTVKILIDQGEVAELAHQYREIYWSFDRTPPTNWFPNPNTLAALFVTNFSNSRYDSLQLEVRRRFQRGLAFEGNYTFSKWLSDAGGADEVKFEQFMDINNPRLARARTPFDLTHALKGNYSYELPLGAGHKIQSKILNRVIDGWSTSGVLTWQSGAPFSIYSSRGTFLRQDFSNLNEANALVTGSALANVVGFQMTGNGPYVIAPSARGPDGRGVAPDGSAPFTGQAFSNPTAGNLGTLQKRMFNGPSAFTMDASLSKRISVTEKIKASLRAEALNVFNHPTFFVAAQGINSAQFGRISSSVYDPRRLQLSVRVNF